MYTLDDFLNLLFEGLTGYVYSPLISAEFNPLTGKKDIEQQFFNWPAERGSLVDWINSSSETGNVYVSPVVYKEQDAHKKYFKASNVAWIEYDGDSLPNLGGLPEPDCIIQSSSLSHQHIYWTIEAGSSPEQIEEINRRISRHVGADAGWNINKVLRPPGTKNHKYENVYTSFVSFSPNGRKSFESFNEARDNSSKPLPVEIKEIPDYADVLAKHSLTSTTLKMVREDVPVAHRSEFLMKLGYILAEEGLKEAEIVALLFVADDRVGKFKDRDDRLLRLSEIAALSWDKVNKDDEDILYSPVEVIEFKQEIEWYIKDWLHSRGGLILSSPPGVGKTQLSLQLAYALSTGTSFLGKDPVKPLKVIFVSLEMEIMELKYIYRKQQKVFKDNLELWEENFLTIAPESDFGTASIDYLMDNINPDVIIIDSLSELAGDDLKETEARRVMKWFKKVRRRYNVAVILIHHNRKGGESNKKPRSLDDLYGSFWFGKSPDTVIGMWKEEGKPIEINALKHRFGPDFKASIERDVETLTFSLVEETDDNQTGEYRPFKSSLGFS